MSVVRGRKSSLLQPSIDPSGGMCSADPQHKHTCPPWVSGIYPSLLCCLIPLLLEKEYSRLPAPCSLPRSHLAPGMHFISEFLFFLIHFHNSFTPPLMFCCILHSLTSQTGLLLLPEPCSHTLWKPRLFSGCSWGNPRPELLLFM